jgi:hypothetical protein
LTTSARRVVGFGTASLLVALAAACGGATGRHSQAHDTAGAGGVDAADGGTENPTGGSAVPDAGSPSVGGKPPSGGATASGGAAGSGGRVAPTGGTSVTASGGRSLTGGKSGSGGATATGGASATGGVGHGGAPTGGAGTAQAGANTESGGTPGSAGAAGAMATAGAPPIGDGLECTRPEDCALDRADCGCGASRVEDATTEIPLLCSHDECAELGVTAAEVTCLRNRCSLGFDCDRSHIPGTPYPPECPEGMVGSVSGGQWGPCVPTEECTPSSWHENPEGLYAGVWLIGWEGDALHFSVLRFPPDADTTLHGDIELLSDPGISGNLPFFACSGVGAFMATARNGGFQIDAPPDCDAMTGLYLVFTDFADANGRWGSTLQATVESVQPDILEAYWFPADTCNASMTACTFGGP